MKLSEGQVMDYVKNAAPYMDERFVSGYVPVEAAPQPALVGTSQPSITAEPETVSAVYNGFPVNNIPQHQNTFQHIVPSVQQIIHVGPDLLKELEEKVSARVEALQSVDAPVGQLQWVLDQIKKLKG